MPQISYEGFIGASYTGDSISVDGQRSINLFPEVVESRHGKSGVYLMGTPGQKLLLSPAARDAGLDTLPDKPVRGIAAGDGRLFVAAGGSFFEVFSNWTYNLLGTINRGTSPVQIFFNGVQLFIVSEGQGYCAAGDIDGVIHITPVIAASTGAYLDTRFIAQTPDSSQFQISQSLDGLTWDPLDFASKEGDAFHLTSMLTDHQLLVLFGSRSTEFWEDAGNPDFPLQRVGGGVIEQGCGSGFSPAKVAPDTFMWQGYDALGEGIIWKATGYNPTRASNHCVEAALQRYRKAGARLDNTVGVGKQHGGHNFYELHVPSANGGAGATWVYDDTASVQMGSPQWHEKASWSDGIYKAPIDRPHAYCFGMHITGDATNGNLYEESLDYFDQAGTPIRRLRSAPHVHANGNMVFYGAFWVDAMVGGASQLLDGAGNVRAPQMMRQISNDGGYTWGNELWRGMGMTGRYKARARWTRGGRARDRCDRIIMTDPIRWVLINCEMEAESGTA